MCHVLSLVLVEIHGLCRRILIGGEWIPWCGVLYKNLNASVKTSLMSLSSFKYNHSFSNCVLLV